MGNILTAGVEKSLTFTSIESQAREGVDFMTVHCGLTRRAIQRLKSQGRVADIVSPAKIKAFSLLVNERVRIEASRKRIIQHPVGTEYE